MGVTMRTFDYRRLPQSLFDGEVGAANVRLYEDKGRFDTIRDAHAEWLEAQRDDARFGDVDSSMHIEGLYVDVVRTRELLEGAEAIEDLEFQIKGLDNGYRLLREDAGNLALSTSSILKFYETLYEHRGLGRKSRYRKKDYMYVQVDGHAQAMPVSPITAFETPLVLGGACDSLADAFSADACSPLLLNAVFTVDFLCIRPFDEGNGRIARLFSQLLLEKSGFDIGRYVSIERIIERTAMEYYDALNACVEGWDRGRNDYAPYATYWLKTLHEAYRQLFAKFDASSNTGKSQRVRTFVEQAGSAVSKRQIREALADVSEATVEAALGKMVKEGIVQKVGAGRSTAYQWLG